ncbi:HD domain-containing protein [Phycicoccus sp.]|uniref:HD domain-containing protein n=1 Tax=Phycicoccus sp. TaxID=1902410 RepID=UPI002C2D5B30|nr:HD domain-containing protein [Phycicoccus sp.]HMM95345.1 HD domain-containing protein [Phycicoccus sp.]
MPMPRHLAFAAQTLAYEAHGEQVDKAGEPYFGHLARVARRVAEQRPDRPDLIAVAWLHDLVEDTRLTIGHLANWGYPAPVVELVHALTHVRNEPRADYVARIRAAGPGAVLVKLADIADNSDPARLAVLPEGDRARLETKYARDRAALLL